MKRNRPSVSLTPRQREVLTLLSSRQTDEEITDPLASGRRTTSTQFARSFSKFAVRNRREAGAEFLYLRHA